MQDDTPWKPPADGGDPAAPSLPPSAPPSAPSLPPSAPASPWAPGGSADAPPSVPPPQAPPLHAPQAPVPPPGAVAAPPRPPAAPPYGESTPGPFVDAPVQQEPRRPKWLVGGAVASVLAVGGAGIFAVANLTGSTAGGSDTPDELGLELLAAIENEDVLGAIDVLVPGEREALGDPFVELVGELTRLDVLADVDLGSLAGVDVVLEQESVQVRSTNVSDIVNIDLRADATVTVDGAELPVGDLVTDNLPDDLVVELRGSRTTETSAFDISLTAVLDDDGRWYFSLFHTVAELARGESPGTNIPFEGIGAVGAESPEAAVDQLLEAVESLDLRLLMQSLDPSEAAALQRYAPIFLPEAETEIARAPFQWVVTEQEIRIEGNGSSRTVFVDALAIEGTADGMPFDIAYDGDCVRARFDNESIEQCESSLSEDPGYREFLAEAPAAAHLIELVEAAFADIEPVGLELRERDGEWYVSPIASVTEAMLKALRALDREELDEIVTAAPPAFEEFVALLFGGFADLGTLGAIDDPGSFDGSVTAVDPGSDPFDIVDDGAPVDGDASQLPDDVRPAEYFDCYEVLDAAGASECFMAYVDAGDIELWEVPVELRFPECGYAELSWAGGVYSLPDDEFIAAAEAARPCFLDALERGAVEAWELPTEITHLECFEGRNWYNVFDDREYDARYYECIGQPLEEVIER